MDQGAGHPLCPQPGLRAFGAQRHIVLQAYRCVYGGWGVGGKYPACPVLCMLCALRAVHYPCTKTNPSSFPRWRPPALSSMCSGEASVLAHPALQALLASVTEASGGAVSTPQVSG